ncbi:hypothetical protein Vadar_004924 [Vaccinium darrowii]|uniref:Uncharacterized protein n=1 Tax=Vaccinium darrowii TaxID=229202 RepID=A0ACB7XFC5_9ERIC|nr:hypothetical protein Vadar_004924 [Vaccinium darrowii]
MPEEENAKKFLSQIADRFVASEKVEACTLLSKLVTMRYNGKGNIREYIMEMSNLVTKMKALKLEFSQEILVYLAVGHVKKDCPKYHKWLAKKGLSKEPDTQ